MKELDSFTVERLEEIIAEEGYSAMRTPKNDEVRALARIALAAKRAEPVAWVVGDEEIADFKNSREVCVMRDCDDEQLDYLPLYTTPQLNYPEIPEGWKLVPIEPTLAMLTLLGLTGSFESILERYANMLDAAPESPL
ncbi:hypothetical protein [Yersinia ruckeri]|uniref:hypothetical protein n=1 Tax=Yersinia ruckeri TaxID=29486 RepID=UPI002237E585|nr:hypothetical protein [Yersinia ruckeri]MCW6600782.1 hypothetical protein [Yersinia ruckeri]MCW6607252.1 hypothetical protein [Yersinia ruckeri]MCW6614187.1 hypothetical protein [Yersinia ruckeri]